MSGAHPKFDFDTVFSADGEVLRAGNRIKRMMTTEEVEVVRQQAFEEGQATETARAAQVQADALKAVASQMQLILTRLQTESETLREQAAVMAVTSAKKIAGAAISAHAAEAVSDFCGKVMQDLRGEPRFNVHCAEAFAGPVAEALEKTASDCGFEGAVIVRADAELSGADCRLEWGSGGVAFSREEIEARIETLVSDWLAAPDEDDRPADDAPEAETAPDAQAATG